ncbi:hypothetical protein ANO14919_058840 [Xylariales sp. No.14919]|nr:hypothetical protein ANO14919_058840 [Xylariales sp. No.14919]
MNIDERERSEDKKRDPPPPRHGLCDQRRNRRPRSARGVLTLFRLPP